MSFWQKSRDLACVVHGDDFTCCGFNEELDWIENLKMSWFEVKVRARSGSDKNDDSEVTILGRTVRWRDWETESPTQVRGIELLRELTNGRVDESKVEVDEVELSESEATKFRGLAARVNFLAQDCLDFQFPAKEVCCHTSFPTFASWVRLKPLARYLVTRKAVIFLYE